MEAGEMLMVFEWFSFLFLFLYIIDGLTLMHNYYIFVCFLSETFLATWWLNDDKDKS